MTALKILVLGTECIIASSSVGLLLPTPDFSVMELTEGKQKKIPARYHIQHSAIRMNY